MGGGDPGGPSASPPSQGPAEPDTSAQAAAVVCVYLNAGCRCGALLDTAKVGQLPVQFGPSSLHRVLREAVQALVDCARGEEKAVFDRLTGGKGKVIITANQNGRTHTKRLPAVERVSSFWSFVEGVLESLGCCENFFSSQPLDAPCPKCSTAAARGQCPLLSSPDAFSVSRGSPAADGGEESAVQTEKSPLPTTRASTERLSDPPLRAAGKGLTVPGSSKRRWSSESVEQHQKVVSSSSSSSSSKTPRLNRPPRGPPLEAAEGQCPPLSLLHRSTFEIIVVTRGGNGHGLILTLRQHQLMIDF